MLSLAVCATVAAFAAAEEGAYPVLLSMGRAAATDRGPQAGDPPYELSQGGRSGRSGAPRNPGSAALTGVARDLGAQDGSAGPRDAGVIAESSAMIGTALAPSPASSAATVAPDASMATARMKRWAMRLFRLAPSTRRARPRPEVVAPVGGARLRRAAPRPGADGDASRDGVRRGFSELLAVASCDLP